MIGDEPLALKERVLLLLLLRAEIEPDVYPAKLLVDARLRCRRRRRRRRARRRLSRRISASPEGVSGAVFEGVVSSRTGRRLDGRRPSET